MLQKDRATILADSFISITETWSMDCLYYYFGLSSSPCSLVCHQVVVVKLLQIQFQVLEQDDHDILVTTVMVAVMIIGSSFIARLFFDQ